MKPAWAARPADGCFGASLTGQPLGDDRLQGADSGHSLGHYRALRSTPHRSFVAGATGGHAAGKQTIRSCETGDNDQRLKGARRSRPSLYCDGGEPSVPVQPVERKLAAIFAADIACYSG